MLLSYTLLHCTLWPWTHIKTNPMVMFAHCSVPLKQQAERNDLETHQHRTNQPNFEKQKGIITVMRRSYILCVNREREERESERKREWERIESKDRERSKRARTHTHADLENNIVVVFFPFRLLLFLFRISFWKCIKVFRWNNSISSFSFFFSLIFLFCSSCDITNAWIE